MIDPIRKNNVSVIGNGDASRTLVFVHGFGTDQSAWKDVAAPFLKECRVVLMDNVGAGRSEPEAFVQHRYLNLRTYVSDLLDVCEALEVTRATFIGHSVGGMICALAALRKPELFSRLIMIGASPHYLEDGDYHGGFGEKDLSEIYRAITLNYSEWTEGYARIAMGNAERPNLAASFAASLKSIPASNALTVLCSIFQSDHRSEIDRLAVPTLLIQTRKDEAVPLAVAEYLHRHIKGSRLTVIDATGHLPHVSDPDLVIGAMRQFIYDNQAATVDGT